MTAFRLSAESNTVRLSRKLAASLSLCDSLQAVLHLAAQKFTRAAKTPGFSNTDFSLSCVRQGRPKAYST